MQYARLHRLSQSRAAVSGALAVVFLPCVDSSGAEGGAAAADDEEEEEDLYS
jgi:hypothetical protein